ncbi:hypothetical protein ACIPYS_06490 [Kitasatospora sp. NPDC089913]|uniref:hypothetical protein n=1 Tax=Kitasatospora sp. NPDC089913 TaxID=3364080 RepID=UPI0038093E19
MLLTVSAAVFFGAVLLVMLRQKAVPLGGALVAALFGFYLASTGVAPAVNAAVVNLVRALPGAH